MAKTSSGTRSKSDQTTPQLLREEQVAALCYRQSDRGKPVLLITSRGTGRWIIPKGWPIKGLNGPQSALQEAWEEAGVKTAKIEQKPIGQYEYFKGLESGQQILIETQVYLARVVDLVSDYPEVDERSRKWVSPKAAAKMVDEPELRDILNKL